MEGTGEEGKELRGWRLDFSFEIVPKNVSYENKPNKSPVSDVRVIGNEIGCR